MANDNEGRVPTTKTFVVLRVYFLCSLFCMLIFIGLLIAGLVLLEVYEKEDIQEDEELTADEKQKKLSSLRLNSTIVSCLICTVSLQVVIGWAGISRFNTKCLVVYGFLDVVSAILLVVLAIYVNEYRVIILSASFASLLHVIVSYTIIREIKRADRFQI